MGTYIAYGYVFNIIQCSWNFTTNDFIFTALNWWYWWHSLITQNPVTDLHPISSEWSVQSLSSSQRYFFRMHIPLLHWNSLSAQGQSLSSEPSGQSSCPSHTLAATMHWMLNSHLKKDGGHCRTSGDGEKKKFWVKPHQYIIVLKWCWLYWFNLLPLINTNSPRICWV